MRFIIYRLTMVLVFLLLLPGCMGEGVYDPTAPGEHEYDGSGYHVLLGAWTADFDLQTLSVNVVREKYITEIYPVTTWIDTPTVAVNAYDPQTGTIDVDCTIENNYTENAFDLRLIIFTTQEGCTLENPDQWTNFYRAYNQEVINPFKAYAKDEPNRTFAVDAVHTENLLVRLPEGCDEFVFAIDASKTGNCPEPYKFENFLQGTMYPQLRAKAYLQIDVYDWQGNIDEVALYCPEITDSPYDLFNKVMPNTWGVSIVNRRAAPPGEYYAIIAAGSGEELTFFLSDLVKIAVTPDTFPPNWVTDVGITDAIAGNNQVTVYWGMATDEESPSFAIYLLYMDTDDFPWDQEPVQEKWHKPYTFKELENGTTYWFGVRCMDDAESPNIDTNDIVILATPTPFGE